jgi:hypothetical protein
VSSERRARIAELEAEAQKLRVQEDADHEAVIKARVDTLFQGLHLSDVELVRKHVDLHARRLHTIEGDDDE